MPAVEASDPDHTPFALRFEYANENRQATIGLGGTGVAILTFLLIFLDGRFAACSLGADLFRITLVSVVVSIFFLGVAGSYYYFLIEALERRRGDAGAYLRYADGAFVTGLALLLLEPGLILITLAIYDVGAGAIGLWAVSLVVIGRGRSALAQPRSR